MKMTNKQVAAILRDVAKNIESVGETTEEENKYVLAQMERIPVRTDAMQDFGKAFLNEFTKKRVRPEEPPKKQKDDEKP